MFCFRPDKYCIGNHSLDNTLVIGSLDHPLSKSRSFANDGWIERVRPRSDVSGLTFDQFLISRAAKNWQRSVFTCLRGQIDHDSVGALCIDSNVTRNKRVYRVYVRCDWATSKQLLWFIACIIRTVYQKPDSGLSYSRCPSASPPPPSLPFNGISTFRRLIRRLSESWARYASCNYAVGTILCRYY